jgi:4-amino-4-deoxy-L-arabinose transferase-like glycosyltransferase
VSEARGSSPALLDAFLRPGRSSNRDIVVDLAWLLGLGLLLIGAGLGLRDPWPADEPRFALVAQDMLRSGDWLIPRVGGDLYADKPPLYFWMMAVSMAVTGSVRAGFLLPSLLAGLGTLLASYDLLRRAHGREVALAGAFVLLVTFQFVWQARQAQIDGTLCFLTTLSLYGLLRHLLLGPSRGWYVLGWAAAGLGVITKGVGFLPLLALVPAAVLAWRGWTMPARSGWLIFAGVFAMLAAIGLWFVPMMVATAAGGELLAYRNEILFHQTVTRYADAWHHHEPFWYYLVRVIPLLWLPLIALVPWLWPRWRRALAARDARTAVLLAWVVIVVAFFSLSSGKRGVYVLPALPALAMAAAPWLPELMRAPGPRRAVFALACMLTLVVTGAAIYLWLDASAGARIVAEYDAEPVLPLAVMAAGALASLLFFRQRDAFFAYAGVLTAVLLTIGFIVNPRIDEARSGRAFMQRVEQATAEIPELGLVGAKEQYLLQLRRPSVNFGHARWREKEDEAADAAVWLAARPGRALLLDGKARQACFSGAQARELGRANRQDWFLVSGKPDAACLARGNVSSARLYEPGNVALNTGS